MFMPSDDQSSDLLGGLDEVGTGEMSVFRRCAVPPVPERLAVSFASDRNQLSMKIHDSRRQQRTLDGLRFSLAHVQ